MSWLSVLAPVVTEGVNLAFQDTNNENQLEQQGALDAQQLSYQEQGAQYGVNLANTQGAPLSYPAQVQQMNEAGLNPSMLYAKGAMGGQMIGGMSVGSAQAPAARPINAADLMGIALQAAETDADVQLKDKQGQNIDADTVNKEHQTPQIDASVANIQAQTGNTQADTALKQAQTTGVGIINDINSATTQTQIDQAGAQLQLTLSNAKAAAIQAGVSEATVNTQISAIKAQLVGQLWTNELTGAQVENTNQQTDQSKEAVKQMQSNIAKMTQDINQGWTQIAINWDNMNTAAKQQQVSAIIQQYQAAATGQPEILKFLMGIKPQEMEQKINAIMGSNQLTVQPH